MEAESAAEAHRRQFSAMRSGSPSAEGEPTVLNLRPEPKRRAGKGRTGVCRGGAPTAPSTSSNRGSGGGTTDEGSGGATATEVSARRKSRGKASGGGQSSAHANEPRYDPPDENNIASMSACFDRATSALETLRVGVGDEELRNSVDALAQDVRALYRRALDVCERCAIEISCMRCALEEETVDMDVRSARIGERQRALFDLGRTDDANAVAAAFAAAKRVDEALATLHPHELYARPGVSPVNGPLWSFARRADDR